MPSQLEGASACFKPGDLLIFSNGEDTIDGHQIIDILDYLPDSYNDMPDFQPYIEQKRMRENGSAKSTPKMLKTIDG